MAKLNPVGMAELQRRLQQRAVHAAHEAAEVLRAKLGGEGSGVHYAGLPRRSSAPGEYPAKQTGELQASVGSRPRKGGAEFGLLDAPPYTAALHFKPPAAGGRPVMDMALADDDIQRAVRSGFMDGGKP